MNIFLYSMLFIMGTFFGSFFTLAVYRIPLKKDITHERSFCPNCNHKLGAWDLIPVWSYLFLKGKCRYCGEKVRIRYLILEVLSGVIFVISYLSFHIEDIFLQNGRLAMFVAFVFLYVTVVLVAGIDKEYRKIHSSILLFGVICQTLYIVYLYVIEKTSIYRYIIYLILWIILLLFKFKQKGNYWLEVLLLLGYIGLVLGFSSLPWIGILSLGLIGILRLICPQNDQQIQNFPLGFSICFSTIVYAIVENFIEFWII